jgi:hypothetical protein
MAVALETRNDTRRSRKYGIDARKHLNARKPCRNCQVLDARANISMRESAAVTVRCSTRAQLGRQFVYATTELQFRIFEFSSFPLIDLEGVLAADAGAVADDVDER